ncbi:MAG: tRNA (N(6)-L-threonylcarbamoyladenosine(37)-C(2))-methylthiotransferase MtaB, partial [Lachnospiraceae bacterium]
LTTDVIVGFPGETKEEFEQSKAFVEEMNFYETHIFKYSQRKGTKAATMPNQVNDSVKTARSSLLLQLDQEKRWLYEEAWMGNTVEVLMEEQVNREGQNYMVGHTKEYMKVMLPTEENLQNKSIFVKIDNHSQIIH